MSAGAATSAATSDAARPAADGEPAVARLLHALAVRAIDAGSGGHAAVGVASVLHGEGATTIACALATCATTMLGLRAVLVDANLRSPALRRLFALAPGPGLTDVLAGRAPLETALRAPTAFGGRLFVLPAGETPSADPRAFSGAAVPDLIAGLQAYAEMVVFDVAPLGPYPDAKLLSRHLDGNVVVLRAERSRWEDGEQAAQDLRDCGANLLGAVLNRYNSRIPPVLQRLL